MRFSSKVLKWKKRNSVYETRVFEKRLLSFSHVSTSNIETKKRQWKKKLQSTQYGRKMCSIEYVCAVSRTGVLSYMYVCACECVQWSYCGQATNSRFHFCLYVLSDLHVCVGIFAFFLEHIDNDDRRRRMQSKYAEPTITILPAHLFFFAIKTEFSC